MTCKGREHLAQRIKDQLPEVIINFDDFTDSGKFTTTAWYNYKRGWELAGDEPCVQMDDDIILTSDFKNKIDDRINNPLSNYLMLLAFLPGKPTNLHR